MNVLPQGGRWRIAALAVVLVIVVAGALVVLRGSAGPESGALGEDQQVIPVRRGDLIDAIRVSGTVRFPERADMTFGSDGVVEAVLVKEGQRVSAGDPIATLDAETVARLEREVTDARASVRDAETDLDAIIDPPALVVVEAEHRVEIARVALDEASLAFERIMNPTGHQVALAEAKVSSATLDLETAQEKLAESAGPASSLEVARARARVTDAEMKLAVLENTSGRLELAQAESRVAEAEVALQAATEALDEYTTGPTALDLQDARDSVTIAETEIANSRSGLDAVEREWAASTDEARQMLDAATGTYLETYKKWLGIQEASGSIDPDYRTALAGYGIDLEVLFSLGERFSGLEYGASELPSDDPSTPWDETQVYVWLHFSRHDLVPTCERGERRIFGVCIEEEFRIASDSYRNAIDSLLVTESQAADAIAAARSRVDRAETALRAASDNLGDLEDLPDPLVAEQLKAAVHVAQENLAMASMELHELSQPSGLLIRDRNQRIEVARATLEETRKELDELLTPGRPSETADLEVKVTLAEAGLREARVELAELTSGTGHPNYAASSFTVDIARETLAEESRKLESLTGDPDPIDLALAQSSLDAAKTLLAESEQRLGDATLRAPWDGFVSRVEARAGREIRAADVVVVLVDTSVVEIDGTVDEVDVLRVGTEAVAEVRMEALPDETISGMVSFVGAEASSDEGVVSYPVRVRIDLPPDLKAPEGLSAVATITISELKDVLLLPANAIRGSFTHPTVDLMADEVVVETPVTLGDSDDFWTAVTGGVSEGDMVVVEADVSIPELATVNEEEGPQP